MVGSLYRGHSLAGRYGAPAGLWKASDIPVMPGQVRGSRLYILQASLADAGEYVCRASNGQEATITVTVTTNNGANFAYRE